MTGKRRHEFMPKEDADWHEANDRQVVEAGRALEFEEFSRIKGRSITWLTTKFPLRDAQGRISAVAGISADISARKEMEEALREAERRQAFLLKLSDALRPLLDAGEIQFEASRILGEHLGAARAGYAEAEGDTGIVTIIRCYANGVPGIEGRHSLHDYGAGLHADLLHGRPVVWEDIPNHPGLTDAEKAAFAALPVAGMVDIPLVKAGRLVAILFVHYAQAHTFTVTELSLIEEVAERTWAAVERARAETALRESEDRLRRVLETEAVAVLFFDANGALINANEVFLRMTGYTRDQIERRELTWRTMTPDEWVAASEEQLRRLAEAGRIGPYEKEYFLADGSRRWMLFAGRDLGDGTAVEYCVDIHAQKKAEEALRESEQRFKRLIDSNIIGIVTADLNGVKAANDLYLQMIGATREDLEAGRVDWMKATPPEHIDKDLRALEELRTRGWCSPFEKDYLHPDGTRVPILIGAATLKPEPLEWICFVLDLTEQKALERRLRETQKLESIGLLAGGIAHDFNNLLTGIVGNASLAEDSLPAESPVQPFLGEIIRAGERAAHLTREMLAYAGKGRFVIQPLSISEAVLEITNLTRSSIPNSVTVHLDLAPNLPLVEADPGQMQQLIMNLVLNAAEAIGGNGGVVTVRASRRDIGKRDVLDPEFADLVPGTYVCLEVRDTGCGMDAGTQTRIFDPFFTTKFTGRGLGLAAVSGIVRAQNGAIRVTSAPGQGATFEVLLPASTSAEPLRGVTEPAQTDLRGGGTILVIDDEDVVLSTARAALERQGYNVLLAESGQAAIDILAKDPQRVDLVLLDLSMPGMDGQQALRELRKITPGVRVVISSGYSEAECLRLFADEEISGFVEKPYTAARLAEKVKSAIAGR